MSLLSKKVAKVRFDRKSKQRIHYILNKLFINRLLLFTKVAKSILFSTSKKVFKNSVRSF